MEDEEKSEERYERRGGEGGKEENVPFKVSLTP